MAFNILNNLALSSTINHSKATSKIPETKHRQDDASDETNLRQNNSARITVPIAVIGMACRLPGHCNSPHALWEFLKKGGVAENKPPASRFNLEGHFDENRKPRAMKSPGGMFMEDVNPELFDGQFFNISRTDCIAMDPQQRQLLEVTYECLENAGLPLEMVSGKAIGCLVGANAVDYEGIQSRNPEDRPESATIGVARSILSNRISHFLNIKGPSMTIDTACSSSLVSVDVACRYLDSYQVDGMIVAGANMWLNPEHNEEIGMMHATQSASGKCHTFDAKADGYVKAEAINVVFLKRLDDAIKDRDPIRAIIKGSSANSAGRTPGLASPSVESQAAAIRSAYSNAGIRNFADTGYLECHGTGTLVGDPIEVAGAASVFAEGRSEDLIIGSIKSNIGHSEAAAGVSALIKAVMAVELGMIPGNPTFIKPNPGIDFQSSKVRAIRHMISWPSCTKRRASINSFGFGGANAHVVLEAAHHSPHVSSHQTSISHDFFNLDDESDTVEKPKLLVFSANDEKSLKNSIAELSTHLINPAVSVNIDDLAYTLSERRSRHYYRAFTVSETAKIDLNSMTFGKKSSSVRIGMVFTGQGAQWSQMGLDLINTFPAAKRVVQGLDSVLQRLSSPPKWSLLQELTEPRSAQALRQPEFSQPLVTALQLAIAEILREWNVHPASVVGHSSGEIAAATAAGLITPEEAIVVAFLRGRAAKQAVATDTPLGMLAVGLSAAEVASFLDDGQSPIQIACYNSPTSLTLSGAVSALEQIMERLESQGHFARMLLVDLAYHSNYMTEIGEEYEKMLLEVSHFSKSSIPQVPVKFFSSVTGDQLDTRPNAAYWKTNMVSPVKFAQAASTLLKDEEPANFLIEVGPSNALSGPITQIKKSLSGSSGEFEYISALKRGQGDSLNLLDVAGRLFLAGGQVDIRRVNETDGDEEPAVIVDLPNYSWNHSTRYWHESLASKDWRHRKFPNHDLLGSKMLGTPWVSPVFQKVLTLADMPWLKDHKLGKQVVFPGAGYVAMAVEAIYQTTMMTKWMGKAPTKYRYCLRDVKFSRALVLEEEAETRFILSLTPLSGVPGAWLEFKVSSQVDSMWTEHSWGLIKVEVDYHGQSISSDVVKPLQFATPASLWYKAMSEAGYNFGKAFQKHLRVESTTGQRQSRSTVSLQSPPSRYGQSFYPIHPACLDGCLQTVSPALWEGDRTNVTAVLVPTVISSLIITAHDTQPAEGLAVASAEYQGVGRVDSPANYGASSSVYDPQTGNLLFEMRGLRLGELETSDEEIAGHIITKLSWQPDISLLLSDPHQCFGSYLEKTIHSSSRLPSDGQHGPMTACRETLIDTVINIVAHKTPTFKVLELNLDPQDVSSLWFGTNQLPSGIREACSKYQLVCNDPATLVAAKERYATSARNVSMDLLGSSKLGPIPDQDRFQFAIVKSPGVFSEDGLKTALETVEDILTDSGYILIVFSVARNLSSQIHTTITGPASREVHSGALHELGNGIYLYTRTSSMIQAPATPPMEVLQVSLVEGGLGHLSETLEHLRPGNCEVRKCINPLEEIGPGQTVLILDEMFDSVMSHLSEPQLQTLQHIVRQECKVLWVTSGAHLKVTQPDRAAINGFLRVIRAEEPTLRLITLDVEQHKSPATAEAIQTCLRLLHDPTSGDLVDSEFVERDGFLFISRVLPDVDLIKKQSDEISELETDIVDLHTSEKCIRLRAERLGNVDSVHYGEVSSNPLPLEDGCMEVEILAAGMNYKDVVVTMGIVPGNEHTLGGEGAGIVTRVSPDVTSFKPGQRVVVYQQGTFANRVQTTPGRAHVIPDDMSFEEAATLCIVYMTSMYSLFDMGNVVQGSKVLIHSAAGGVGIAAIQLCQYAGAQLYVTVGTQEKKQYLKSTFGLSDDQIFDSRTTAFAKDILAATYGKGIDVVLNSLTGDLLDESWRILADGGTMVEIGKRDILDRNHLAMEPFDRNISFRAVDMSHERVSDHLSSRLMSQLFQLIEQGHIKPIAPIHCFSFSEVSSAIRFLRAGTHIGKVVITDGAKPDVRVPVRRAPRPLSLRQDRCYLIVGGLKGLCGSLAVFLAKSGAKYLAVLSRSGHEDEKSQGIVHQVQSQGCNIDLLAGDVTNASDVEAALRQTTVPVLGIIQGAMVLRDRIFSSMTIDDYHGALACKIQGTWNLHNVAEKLNLELDFFTMLSSISGVVGQKGQANYAAGNAFLDSFANYRRQRGQPACSVDLGVIEDLGYIHDNEGMQEKLDTSLWKGINERLLRKIVHLSILQQQHYGKGQALASSAQIITGIPVPQPEHSQLRRDARFASLFTRGGREMPASKGGSGGDTESKDVQVLLLLLRSESPERGSLVTATVEVIGKCLMRVLRLSEPVEKDRPISVYGIDSLAAVEVRNWIRMHLGALVTTLDIMNSSSLVALCEKIIDKVTCAGKT